MAVDYIRYDILAQEALRGVVRTVLADTASKGLPGEHHFYITIDTRAEGVKLSPRLRTEHPVQMTIVLQHQFWDLSVSDEGFSVGLWFNGIPEKLTVPWGAITEFVDPAVEFGLRFAVIGEAEKAEPPPSTAAATGATVGETPRPPARHEAKPTEPPAPDPTSEAPETPDRPDGGGEVVRLDRFRKK
jgi:uncharacterized protein